MPGKSIIILLLGMILTIGIVLTGIFKTNNSITKNMVSDYQKKQTYNIAQSGANLGLRQLRDNPTYRINIFTYTDLMGGKVSIRIIDTTLTGDSVVAVKSIGYSNFGTPDQVSSTSIAIVPRLFPPSIKGTFVTNSVTAANGNALVDGRNHNLNQSLTSPGGTGIVGIWSTGTVMMTSSANVGGTANGIDYVPQSPPDPNIVLQNQVYVGGYPTTPDQVMGGPSFGYTEGTLKLIAQSGSGGSYYGTVMPTTKQISGVTFIDLYSDLSGATINGSGILVFNNKSAGAISLKLMSGTFSGIMILANNINVDKLHGTIVGVIATTSTIQTSNTAINGNGSILYSSQAVINATKYLISKNYVWFEQ